MVVLDVAALAPAKAQRWLLTVLAAVLYGVGWAVARVVTLVPAAALWCVAAVGVGWSVGRAPSRP